MWAQFIQINSAFGSHRILRRIIFLKILLLIIASTQAVLISFFFFPIICKGIAKLFRCSFVCESLRFYYRNCVFDSRAVPTRIPANGVRHFQYCIGAREPSLTNEAYWIISLITFLTNKKKNRKKSQRAKHETFQHLKFGWWWCMCNVAWLPHRTVDMQFDFAFSRLSEYWQA